jgi:hypothetical protein
MLKRKFSNADLLLIAANLFPVYGVWFLGWSTTEAFIVYAMETMIAGGFTVLKLLIATIVRKKDEWPANGRVSRQSGFFFIFFFIVHYGFFSLVQTTLFSQAAHIAPANSGLFHFFFNWHTYVNKDVAYMLFAFIFSYTAGGFIPFLQRKEYKTMPMIQIMFQPYGRIFIQQFTVILGSMFLTIGIGKAFILVFVSIKIFFELLIDYPGMLKKAARGGGIKNNSAK